MTWRGKGFGQEGENLWNTSSIWSKAFLSPSSRLSIISVTLGSIYACKIRWGSGLDGLDKIGAFEGYEGIEGIETSGKVHPRPELFFSPGSAGVPPALPGGGTAWSGRAVSQIFSPP
jgi:hypothetical protein